MPHTKKITPAIKKEKKERITHTLTEIAERYRILNENLFLAISIFISIRDMEIVTMDNFKQLKEIDLSWEKLYVCESEKKHIHGNSTELLYRKPFISSIKLMDDLFYTNFYIDWDFEIVEIKGIILSNAIEASQMLDIFNNLITTLKHIIDEGEFTSSNYIEKEIDDSFASRFKLITNESLNFTELLENVNTIDSIEEKLKYLTQDITRKKLLQINLVSNTEYNFQINCYIERCQKAINIIRQIDRDIEKPLQEYSTTETNIADTTESIDTEFENSISPKADITKDCTTRRQTMAIYYLLMSINPKLFGNVDKTKVAELISNITNRNYNNVYKIILNPFKPLNSEKARKGFEKDIDFIKQQFANIGLTDIITKIEKDMAPE